MNVRVRWSTASKDLIAVQAKYYQPLNQPNMNKSNSIVAKPRQVSLIDSFFSSNSLVFFFFLLRLTISLDNNNTRAHIHALARIIMMVHLQIFYLIKPLVHYKVHLIRFQN